MNLNSLKIKSPEMKMAVMHYFRYKRQGISATEVDYGCGIADVLSYVNNKIIEVEIKTSFADFKNDFKKGKHLLMEKNSIRLPNQFYFCVPYYLTEKVKDYLVKLNNKSGVMEYKPNNQRPMEWIRVVKNSPTIHEKFREKTYNYIIKRLNSEVCRMYQDKFTLSFESKDQLLFEYGE